MRTRVWLIIACGAVLVWQFGSGSMQAPSRPDDAASTTGAPWNPSERYHGTDSFVPDWRAAEVIDAKASDFFLRHHWPRYKGDHDKGGTAILARVSAAERASGLVVFQQSFIDPLLPDDVPTAAARSFSRASLVAAHGESEPVVIGVRTLDAARAVSVEVSDLIGLEGRIDRRDVTNRLMLPYRPLVGTDGKTAGRMQQMVLLKTPGNSWTFPPRYSMAYVVDVHVPIDAKPGRYAGTVTVKSGGVVAQTIAVDVEVLPFTLKTNNFHAGGFGVTWGIWEGGFTGYYAEMMEMDARYGFNLAGGFFNKGAEIPFRRDGAGRLEVDSTSPKFKTFHDTMSRLRAFGMAQVAFWNWGASGTVGQFNGVLAAAGYPPIDTDAGKRGFAEMCRAIKEAERRYQWPELVINPFDEALMDQDATRAVIEAMSFVHVASPDTRIYMTEWREHYARLYQSSGRTLRGRGRPGRGNSNEYDALVASREPPRLNFHVIGANRVDEESRLIQHDLGGEYWHYTTVPEVGPQARFAYGFKPWIVQAQATLIWATYKGDLDGSGWTLHYLMPEDKDHQAKKLTRGPVVASARAIGTREGIDARKYIETLRYYAQAKHSTDNLRFLDDLSTRSRDLADLSDIGGVENREATGVRGDAFDRLRAEIRGRIVALLRP
jgi:hypothetical protein